MNHISLKKVAQIRERHNHDLIRRMRTGDSLCTFDSRASWFPPRPVIKKDKKEVARLYGEDSPLVADKEAAKEDEAPSCDGAMVKRVDFAPTPVDDGPFNEAG